MVDFSGFDRFDLDFQPETYWPAGFRPVVTEKRPPPVAEPDPGGEVYWDAAGRVHYVQYPDEVEIAVIGRTKRDSGFRLCAHRGEDERIHYRYVLEHADESADPPLLVPGIVASDEPLQFGELGYLIDTTLVDDPDRLALPGLMGYVWTGGQEAASVGARRSSSQGKSAESSVYPHLADWTALRREAFIEHGAYPGVGELPSTSVGVTRSPVHAMAHDLGELLSYRPPSTFDLSRFEMDFRPETYWPDGFTPFVAEPDAPPVHRMDANGEVYEDETGWWHYVTFPDEVVLAQTNEVEPEYLCARRVGDRIRYRYVVMMDASVQGTRPMLTPGIEESEGPLSFGELVWSMDQTVVSGDGIEPDSIGYQAWRWDIDTGEQWSRTDRMFLVNQARPMRSEMYPALEGYERAVGTHFVQTGEFFEMWERPE